MKRFEFKLLNTVTENEEEKSVYSVTANTMSENNEQELVDFGKLTVSTSKLKKAFYGNLNSFSDEKKFGEHLGKLAVGIINENTELETVNTLVKVAFDGYKEASKQSLTNQYNKFMELDFKDDKQFAQDSKYTEWVTKEITKRFMNDQGYFAKYNSQAKEFEQQVYANFNSLEKLQECAKQFEVSEIKKDKQRAFVLNDYINKLGDVVGKTQAKEQQQAEMQEELDELKPQEKTLERSM